jgi:predicted transcriptional regulator
MNQEPGWEWGNPDRSKRWLLDEAGSYGYLVTAHLHRNDIKRALEEGRILVRLEVRESDKNKGGLSVYGKESGMFPLDPSIIIRPR